MRRTILLWAGLLGVTLIVSVVGAVISEPSKPQNNSTIDAKIFCNEIVRQGLKAPATASFASYGSQTTTTQGSGAISVASYVDSQNSFGANLRTSYTCVARKSGSDWSLVSLNTSP